MNSLDCIALKHGTDKASSHHDYCRVYEPLFEPMRDKPISLLEIGVQFGHSIKTWLEYFEHGEIYGMDIVDQFKTENPRFHFLKGSLEDQQFIESCQLPTLDIVIDDGPHIFTSSAYACDYLWPRLKSGGLFCIEDLPCWWDDHYQCLYDTPNYYEEKVQSRKEWIDRLIGNLNNNGKTYFGKPSPPEPLSGMETEIEFVHCYRGLIIIKKK